MASNQPVKPTKLNVDSTMVLNLKAELLRKQEEFRSKKVQQSSAEKSSQQDEYQIQKTQSKWGKRKKETKEDKSKEETRQVSDDENSEDKLLEKSRKMLESKTRYYEDMMQGKKKTEEGDDEIFLVDFDQKVSTDDRARSSVDDEKAFKDQMKERWERQIRENYLKDSVRYQDIKFDEVRNMGVGHFEFSRDQVERQKQMEFFRNMDMEVKKNRLGIKIHKLRRQKILLERLSRVKQRRLLKGGGFSLEQIQSMPNFEQDLIDIQNEIVQLTEILNDPEALKSIDKESSTQSDETTNESDTQFGITRPKSRVILDRDWDKPKLREKMWEKHVEKLRKERNKAYAPPSSYNTNKSNEPKKKKKAASKPETVKEEKAETSKAEARTTSTFNIPHLAYQFNPLAFAQATGVPFPSMMYPPQMPSQFPSNFYPFMPPPMPFPFFPPTSSDSTQSESKPAEDESS